MENTDEVTTVWRLSGLTGSSPGYLSYVDDVVRLQIEDDAEELQTLFEVPKSQVVDVNWPAMQFSGGCSFHVDGEKYRLSFLQPQNTRMPNAIGAVGGVASISGGRKAGKLWKARLAG